MAIKKDKLAKYIKDTYKLKDKYAKEVAKGINTLRNKDEYSKEDIQNEINNALRSGKEEHTLWKNILKNEIYGSRPKLMEALKNNPRGDLYKDIIESSNMSGYYRGQDPRQSWNEIVDEVVQEDSLKDDIKSAIEHFRSRKASVNPYEDRFASTHFGGSKGLASGVDLKNKDLMDQIISQGKMVRHEELGSPNVKHIQGKDFKEPDDPISNVAWETFMHKKDKVNEEEALKTRKEMLKKIEDLKIEQILSSPDSQRMLKDVPSQFLNREQIQSDLESSYVQRPEERFYEPEYNIPEFNQGGIVDDKKRLEELLRKASSQYKDLPEEGVPSFDPRSKSEIMRELVDEGFMKKADPDRAAKYRGMDTLKAGARGADPEGIGKKYMEKAKLQGSKILPEGIDPEELVPPASSVDKPSRMANMADIEDIDPRKVIAPRHSGDVAKGMEKFPSVKDLEFPERRLGGRPFSKVQREMMPSSKRFAKGALKKLGSAAGLAGPAIGAALALSSGDANAALGDLLGSDPIGEGSDVIPGRPDTRRDMTPQLSPEEEEAAKKFLDFRPRRRPLVPDSGLYADGGIIKARDGFNVPMLSTSISGEDDDLNYAQRQELGAAGRGELEQGILDESGPIPPGVIESQQEIKREPSQQSDLLERYEELVKHATTDKKDPEYADKLKKAEWIDAAAGITNALNRYVFNRPDTVKSNVANYIRKGKAGQRQAEKDKFKQRIELFNMYKGLVDQQQAEQYKQDKFALEKDKFLSDKDYRTKQADDLSKYRDTQLGLQRDRLTADQQYRKSQADIARQDKLDAEERRREQRLEDLGFKEAELDYKYKKMESDKKSKDSRKKPPISKGQEELDKQFGKEYADYVAAGGSTRMDQSIATIDNVIKKIEETDISKSGDRMFSGLLDVAAEYSPDFMKEGTRTAINPRLQEIKEDVERVIQQDLRKTLGAQFTEKEADLLLKRSFNPKLSAKANIKRLRQLVSTMKNKKAQMEESARYFKEKGGTLSGFEPSSLKSQFPMTVRKPSGLKNQFPMTVRKDGKRATVSNEEELKEAKSQGWE